MLLKVSSYCASLLKLTHVKCEQRGSVPIKGKGHMITYYVGMDKNFRIIYEYSDDDTIDKDNDESTDL